MSEFLAEASVLIQAQTQAFRAELASALAIVPKAIEIPIIAVAQTGTASAAAATLAKQVSTAAAAEQAGGAAAQQAAAKTVTASQASTNALNQKSAAATRAGVAVKKMSAADVSAANANELLAASAARVAAGEKSAAAAATETSAAQARYRAQVAATTLTERAYREAIASNDLALIAKARSSLLAAKSDERAALASIEAARAATVAGRAAAASAAAQAAAAGEAAKGLQAQALSAAGLRGAIIGANPAFLAATAGAILFGKALGTAVGFDQQLNVFRVTIGATADEMDRVRASAIALGQDIALPGVSAGDAAETMTELAKAGLSVQDSIDGARGVLQLATAAQISNADATQIAAGALNAFGLAGEQATTVADILANSANAAQGSITDMAVALGQSEAVARQVGLSINDTAAILTLLAKNGLQGSDAGTSLRVALLRLVNPTEKAKKVLDDLNLTLRDQQGNIRPEIFAEFAAATARMGRAQQDAKAAIVFGTDAIRLQSILGREGADALHEMQAATEQQGTAAEVAAARNEGLAGAMANLKNQLDTAGLQLGELATGPLTVLADAFADGIKNTNDFIAALARIPKTIPLPHFVGDLFDDGGDGESTGQKVGHAVTEGLKKALFLGPNVAGPLLDSLFPPEVVDTGKAQAAANIRSDIEDVTASAKADAASAHAQIVNAFNKAFGTVGDILAQATSRARGNILRAVKGAGGRQSALEEAMNQILAGGGTPQQQIANLQRQAATQAKIIEDAGPNAAGVLLDARRKARAKQVQINNQIEAIQQGIAADQKAASAKRVQNAQDAAQQIAKDDQKVLDSFVPAQNRLNLQAITANATDRLSDNLKLQDAIIAEANREVKIITDTVEDVKTKNAALAAQAQIIKAAQVERDRIIKQIAQTATENRQKAANALTESLGKAITLADLRENDKAEVAAINRAIANAKFRIRNYKKLGLNLQDEKIALEQLINDRQAVNDKKKDAADVAKAGRGTTAFDLLKEAADTFNASAGNLIGANQPFAGPTGFTADIAQFLIRRQPQPGGAGSTATTTPVPPIGLQDQPLIQAIEKLTGVIIETAGGGANTSTAGPVVHGTKQSRVWHSENLMARRYQEA